MKAKTIKRPDRQVTIVCALDLKADESWKYKRSEDEKRDCQREMVKRISQLNKVIHSQHANCFLDVTM